MKGMEEDELISEYKWLLMLELGLFSPAVAPPVFLKSREMTHSS